MATQIYSALTSAPFGAGMRVVLCEPDPEARSLLRSMLDRDPMLNVVAEASDWRECEGKLEDLLPELLIVSRGALSEDWRQAHRDSALPVVVELMAPAARGIRLVASERQATSPDPDSIRQMLDEAVRKVYERKVEQLWWLMDRYVTGLQATAEGPAVLKVEHDGQIVDLEVDAILSVVAARKYVTIHSTAGVFMLREPIHRVALQLNPTIFVRIHRSVIVNSRQLDRTRSLAAQQAVLQDGSRHPVGPNYRDAFAAIVDAASKQ